MEKIESLLALQGKGYDEVMPALKAVDDPRLAFLIENYGEGCYTDEEALNSAIDILAG